MCDLVKAIYDDWRFKEYSRKQIDSMLYAVGGMTAKEASVFLNAMSAALTDLTLNRVVLDEKW